MDKAPLSFDEFIEWYPENSGHYYELRRGVVVKIPKLGGKHSRLAGDLAFELGTAIRQTNRLYSGDRIISPNFPEFPFTANQVFDRRTPNPDA